MDEAGWYTVERDEYGREIGGEKEYGEVWGVDPPWVDEVALQSFATGLAALVDARGGDEAEWQALRGRIEAEVQEYIARRGLV